LSLCRELRKREETMDQFLATFQETKEEELQRLSNLGKIPCNNSKIM
jgi:hypothetical protein